MSETHVLRAVDNRGNVGYYNGKSGKDWLSEIPSDAFAYTSTRAEEQATRFNRTTTIHGQIFEAVHVENLYVADYDATQGNPADSLTDCGC
jgi:hypothetical protein